MTPIGTEAGRWVCVGCGHVNPPYRYYCFECPRRRESADGLPRMKASCGRKILDRWMAEAVR